MTDLPPETRSLWDEALARALAAAKDNLELSIQGARLRFSHLTRELWPGVTKTDLCRYLLYIASPLLPHLQGRPLTAIRFPGGITGEQIFQKNWRRRPPAFVRTAAAPANKPSGKLASLTVENTATLLWLAQLDVLELHPWLSRLEPTPDGGDPFDSPDIIVFDLDPFVPTDDQPLRAKPPLNPAGFAKTVRVAQALREVLQSSGLTPYVKTSGKTGLHVYVPIQRRYRFETTRALAKAIGERLARELPEDVTTAHAIPERWGKVLIDYSQNGKGKNQVAPYSPRATKQATVSMPVHWDELAQVYPTDFTIPAIMAGLRDREDPWQDFFSHRSQLEAAVATFRATAQVSEAN